MDDFRASRKRRTREHVIADLSINHVERFIFRAGFTSQRTTHDYGTDLMVKTFDVEGRVEPGYLFFQLKATDSINVVGDGKEVSVAIDQRDLNVWVDEIYPVILIIYDANKDRAFWLHVQSHLESLGGIDRLKMSAFRNLRIKARNRVRIKAMLNFAEIKNTITARRKGPIAQ